jgi:hypothetical protein
MLSLWPIQSFHTNVAKKSRQTICWEEFAGPKQDFFVTVFSVKSHRFPGERGRAILCRLRDIACKSVPANGLQHSRTDNSVRLFESMDGIVRRNLRTDGQDCPSHGALKWRHAAASVAACLESANVGSLGKLFGICCKFWLFRRSRSDSLFRGPLQARREATAPGLRRRLLRRTYFESCLDRVAKVCRLTQDLLTACDK